MVLISSLLPPSPSRPGFLGVLAPFALTGLLFAGAPSLASPELGRTRIGSVCSPPRNEMRHSEI
jgi:hypothetical protein